jgi:hypothetical protein
LDVVYVVGPKAQNEELRHSLRSLSNLPHDRVWIAGCKPQWVTNVGFISVQQRLSKYQNSTANILAACAHPEVSDDFIYFNDDFFVMKPMEAIPTFHRGRLEDVIRHYRYTNSSYVRGMRDTRTLLQNLGCRTLHSYELHIPMVINKQKMTEALHHGLKSKIKAVHKRTLYGNLHDIGGTEVEDVKVISPQGGWPKGPFISTSDQAFTGRVGRHIRSIFPEPSSYEVSHVPSIA